MKFALKVLSLICRSNIVAKCNEISAHNWKTTPRNEVDHFNVVISMVLTNSTVMTYELTWTCNRINIQFKKLY